jgi:hypothetical protein
MITLPYNSTCREDTHQTPVNGARRSPLESVKEGTMPGWLYAVLSYGMVLSLFEEV